MPQFPCPKGKNSFSPARNIPTFPTRCRQNPTSKGLNPKSRGLPPHPHLVPVPDGSHPLDNPSTAGSRRDFISWEKPAWNESIPPGSAPSRSGGTCGPSAPPGGETIPTYREYPGAWKSPGSAASSGSLSRGVPEPSPPAEPPGKSQIPPAPEPSSGCESLLDIPGGLSRREWVCLNKRVERGPLCGIREVPGGDTSRSRRQRRALPAPEAFPGISWGNPYARDFFFFFPGWGMNLLPGFWG